MNLSAQQLSQFESEGYLFLPEVFTPQEAGLLRTGADEVFAMQRQEVWRESSGVARTAFAVHEYHETFRRLGRHPRLIGPVMQVLRGPVYMHQFKVNAKVAFNGEVWQWHQDFGTWHRDDEMPEPRAMNIAVFIDDVTAANGPLLMIPRSHRHGVVSATHDKQTTSYPLWSLSEEKVKELADVGGCVAPTGPGGSVLLFSSLMVHASPPNISPLSRNIVYLSLCHVDNHIRRFQRPAWVAQRDFEPIQALGDDCLTELAVPRAA